MIDRSIPYYNLILKCTKICTTPVSLPEGYSFKMYDVGDEKIGQNLNMKSVIFHPLKKPKYISKQITVTKLMN